MNNLYIVATPIGNLQDITLRAIDTLKNVDFIACEDTRVTSILLSKYDIKKPMIVVNEFNEEQITYDILKKLESFNVALVSDAGTPLISDPGFRLVKEAIKRGVRVIPIPGASAIVTALSSSGLPTDKFTFLGFLPKAGGKAKKVLEQMKGLENTIILYESPHRVLQTIQVIFDVFGDIHITLARELTKIHEEIIEKKASALLEMYQTKNPKGEFVILFSTKQPDAKH